MILDDRELGLAIRDVSLLRGDFQLSSGARSSVYFDKFLFATLPSLLRQVAARLAERLPAGVERIAAPELGAVPLGTAVSLEADVPLVIVRKKPKEYGSRNQFEGVLEACERVAVIEDVITSGGEAIRTARLVRDAGAHVLKILAVLDREEGGPENVRAAGFELEALYRRSDIGA